ncbi:MAG TPA: hypothetical protein VFD43_12315, partial [Planctomycetota bacterium]|nr:hypothetical protein [Planctomycetota bacterium]
RSPAGLPPPSAAAPGPLERPAPAQAPRAPVSDEEPQSEDPPREGSEAAYYLRYLELARRDDGSLAAAGERVLDTGAPGPVNERVALLRAAWDAGSVHASAWFSRALTAPGECAAAEAPVPDFALRYLGRKAPFDPGARAVLLEYVASAPADCDAGRLARAVAVLNGQDAVASTEEP